MLQGITLGNAMEGKPSAPPWDRCDKFPEQFEFCRVGLDVSISFASMRLTIGLKRFSCYFFIGTLLLSTLQITVAGFEADENSWFSILTTLLAEEENEDSEVEEESKCAAEYTVHINHIVIIDSNEYFRSSEANQFHLSVLREVFSPPPELGVVLA